MMMRIDPHGTIHALYTEDYPLGELGRLHIRRASNVNPDDQGQWWADVCDNGPMLGPYGTRSEALAAEVAYLETRI